MKESRNRLFHVHVFLTGKGSMGSCSVYNRSGLTAESVRRSELNHYARLATGGKTLEVTVEKIKI